MALANKRVLVTGACGTIGKELIRQLLEENQLKELVALDLLSPKVRFSAYREGTTTSAVTG